MKFDKFGNPIEEAAVPEIGQSEQVEGFTDAETDVALDGGVVDLSTREEPVGRIGKIGKEQVQKAQQSGQRIPGLLQPFGKKSMVSQSFSYTLQTAAVVSAY